MFCTSAPSFAQSAPQPAASVESGLALSHEGVEHRNRRRSATMWAVLGFVVIVVAALLLSSSDDNDEPISA
jgi:hypothetical protein